ncbi:MAG: Asp-tRNA(Asn)/Glu-tRNA(Gln) amidotransferase subunit GatA, partial [Cytophagales bacterium]|nr:Asp-tRNA(Asn)/Glu-tRNA(Gln) amidotransferase subunit GatA [Cytophagales bacterium]
VTEIIAGSDDFDSTVSRQEVPQYSNQLEFKRKAKIGYLKEAIESEGVSPEIKEKTRLTIEKLKAEGHTLEMIELPLIDYVLPTYYILTTAEASSNLSRYDGVRYGYRSQQTTNLESMYKKSRSEAFGKEVQKRIMLGTFVLSASYYDAYFTKAQKVRKLIKEGTDKLLESYDFILTPTAPDVAFKIGEMTKDPLAMYLSDIFTVHANLAGIPAISIPNGVASNGLPIGIQILSGQFKEADLLAFSNYLTNLN